MDEPRTHYQISLTARQAVGLFVGLLLSLGLAFFFGLMAGLSGRGGEVAAKTRVTPTESAAALGFEPLPSVETAVPAASSSRVSRTKIHPAAVGAAAEPTPPPTLEAFEDSTAQEAAAPALATPPAARPAAARPIPGKPAAPYGRIWVQVASLSNRGEAEAISIRLSKHGYRTQILKDGSKGRLRVRVGPYHTTEDARRIAEKLQKQEKIKDPWVVSEGK